MHTLRPPAVAGLFYPADPGQLQATVDRLLIDAGPAQGPAPKAIIAPHAGYLYSGSTAASAYAQLAAGRSTIRRVVLLGPTHRVAVDGIALPECTAFATPLGNIPLDQDGIAAIETLPQVVFSAAAHAREHSLEVHLPFLQQTLDAFTLLPLAVGDCPPAAVAEVLDRLWGGPETLIVVSTDLSHFLSYEHARRVDAATIAAILAGDARLQPEQACGAWPVNGLLTATARHHLQPELLASCNSGDTAGDRQRVVGYASFALREAGHG